MENKRTFKIVIAYENFDAAIHAKKISERLAAHLESACDSGHSNCSTSIWCGNTQS